MNAFGKKLSSVVARRRHFGLALGALLGLSVSVRANADTWVPYLQEWLGFDGARLGASVAVDGDASGTKFVYVGAPNQTVNSQAEAGVVYVWAPSGEGVVPVGTIFPTTAQAGAHFGASVAARDGLIAIGAPDYDGGSADTGAVYFFSNPGDALSIAPKSGWIGAVAGGRLGNAVAVDGGFAVVGAVEAASGSGCIYTYRYAPLSNQWPAFPASNVACGSGGEKLGASVAILATGADTFLAVAGAPAATQNSNALAGAAHLYIPNAGALLDFGDLAAQSPAFLDAFGTSVGIDQDYIYVGATGRDNGAGRVGSVSIFKPAFIIGYDFVDEYFPLAPATVGGHCGASLQVDRVQPGFILGCPDSDTVYYAGEGTARVYRPFEFLGSPVWLESLLTYGSQFHGADALGTSVAINGDQAFAGAPKAHFSGQSNNGAFKEFVHDDIFRNRFDG